MAWDDDSLSADLVLKLDSMSTIEPITELDVQTATDWQQTQEQNKPDYEKMFKDTKAELTKLQQQRSYESSQVSQQETARQDDPEAVKAYLKQMWFMTQDELEARNKLESILSSNPELNKFADFIKTASTNENLAYEDVITKYGLSTSDKLAKAKWRVMPWNNTVEEKDKWVFDLTDEEWQAFQKREMWNGMYSEQPVLRS